jgi:hypothetical protein
LTDRLEEIPPLKALPLLISGRLSRSDTGETVGDQEERSKVVPDGHDHLTVIFDLGFTYQVLAAGLSGRTWQLSRCAHCGTPMYRNLDNTSERRGLGQSMQNLPMSWLSMPTWPKISSKKLLTILNVFLRVFVATRASLAAENLALRQQLAVLYPFSFRPIRARETRGSTHVCGRSQPRLRRGTCPSQFQFALVFLASKLALNCSCVVCSLGGNYWLSTP